MIKIDLEYSIGIFEDQCFGYSIYRKPLSNVLECTRVTCTGMIEVVSTGIFEYRRIGDSVDEKPL